MEKMVKKFGLGVYSTAIVLSASIGFSGTVSADSLFISEQITNGNFEDGLNNWALSNPNSSNENIGTSETGNHYLQLIHEDTALQLVAVKPNTEYTLTFDVAGIIGSPAEVTVGNLDSTQKIVPLIKKQYTGFKPAHHEFKFETGEDVSNFTVKFASTGNGRAKFDNVKLKGKSYILNVDFDRNTNLDPLKLWGYVNSSIEEHVGINNSKGIHLTGSNGGFEGYATFKPNTTYTLSANGKIVSSGRKVIVGAGINGVGEKTLEFTSSQYEQKSVEFTTGDTEASGKVYIYIPSGGSCDAYLDDIVLVEK
ncbi:choline-binding protein A [Bacillus pseudomycoides]|uniref:carbohydrate binding domain-containing protein n=2 Tax=Bacillaceae TaxID=186817 RepID=UPI0001A1332F|nr:carbohydrate binding domain-containing protein [Bacillus pseudomycoides]EEM01793.1 Glycosyl hydrolase, family 16 [Bacillus pseudomycoides]EEM08314.1 Glycosyl hydrolase, family 16 [Bacillus pseudomycoides]MCR8856630.1 choline-binding protein A [Bacillus pseudomycoides]PDZ12318.1 choline-binding protein A [Bacillus pseudomycoides]PDZ72078.1 choline-binding protein A [Bacillus pseudomycoides]